MKYPINSFLFFGLLAAIGSSLSGATLGEWTFNDRTSQASALASSNNLPGVSISGLVFNTTPGTPAHGFHFAGLDNLPAPVYDGYGFGNNSGETVLFLRRAAFFNNSTVPNPRPSVDDYSSFGTGWEQGTSADLGPANAPVSFSVSAAAGYNVTVDSITLNKQLGPDFLVFFQVAGAEPGNGITIANGKNAGTALLNDPVMVRAGETVIFTMNWNSGQLAQEWGINDIQLNGSVSAVPEPSSYGIIGGIVMFAFAMIRRRK